ncbi:MAG: GNAT family N-acetyltransferase [Fibrobacteraceae bacterium]|nr:GNAT family N-acetyltransferase [Fibrobacteraceae bacterium]
MLKGKFVYLRMIELADVELTYGWHNDCELQKMTCGPIRVVSKEIEKNWVLSKTTNNGKDIYLSICLNENDKMIGLISINDIDFLNRKCNCGGILIGDKDYRDGVAYRESLKMMRAYVFEQLNMNKLTGKCLESHVLSRADMESAGYKLEGTLRDEVYKNGIFHNVLCYSLLKSEYSEFKSLYDDEDKYLLVFARMVRKIKKELKQ